jgi:2-polyprenyl-3-methyl-5-hydroxy-6-metoxy-1,4-benzoquinol methylase
METRLLHICPACCANTIRPLWEDVDEWDIVECTSCGLAFVNPQPTLAALKDHYSRSYYRAQWVLRNKARTELTNEDYTATDKFTTLIHQLNPNASEVCDVGCSFGYLLAALRQRGFKVKGYELSATTSAFAREVFHLDVVQGEFCASPRSFDVVIMNHVLEHIPNPGRTVHDIALSLREGGLFIVVVPNMGSLNSRLFGRHCSWVIPPDHLFYFSSNSLSTLLKQHELRLVHAHTELGQGANFYRGLGLAIMSATGRKHRVRNLIGYGVDTKSASPLSFAKRAVVSGCHIMYSLTRPIWNLADRHGYGNDLWVVGKKQ